MTVISRLGVLFLVLGGATLLLGNGLQSPPGLWYATASIVTGAAMIAYTVISSPHQPPSSPPEPTSPNTSSDTTTSPTTDQADSQLAESPQTAESTESADQGPGAASEEDLNSPESPPSQEQSEPPSTTVKVPHHIQIKDQQTHRPVSNANSSQTRKSERTSTRKQRHVTSTASPRRAQSTGTDNPYFKPGDLNHEIKFAQIDTKFSYLDVDLGPEFIDLDPIPDLIEVDIGPSVVSQELVRSPVEIKISSFLKTLLTPTPHNSVTSASDDGARMSMGSDNQARQRTGDTRARRGPTTRDSRGTPYREENWHVDRHCDSPSDFSGRRHPGRGRSRSSDRELDKHCQSPEGLAGYESWEGMGVSDSGRSDDRRPLGWKPAVEEEQTGTQNVGVVDEPAVDVGMDYSPPRWDPSQGDFDPFEPSTFDPGFSEPEQSIVEPVGQSELGFEAFDWKPDVAIEESVVDPEIGEEMFGLDGFTEPHEESVGLPGLDADNDSTPLFPDATNFFPDEDEEDDWLSF